MSTHTKAHPGRARHKRRSSNPPGLVWLILGISVFAIALMLVLMRGDNSTSGIGSMPDFSATTVTSEPVPIRTISPSQIDRSAIFRLQLSLSDSEL